MRRLLLSFLLCLFIPSMSLAGFFSGGSPSAASTAEVAAGTVENKYVNPKELKTVADGKVSTTSAATYSEPGSNGPLCRTGSGAVGACSNVTDLYPINGVLTGYTSGAGTVAATDTILQAIQKLNGNDGNLLSTTAPAVIDGSAHVHLTAAQMSDPRCQVSNYNQTNADINIGLPTAAAGLSCLFTVATAQSNHWGVLAATNDAIYIVAADGSISAKGDDAAAAVMTAAVLGQSFACWTQVTGAGPGYDWFCKAIALGGSTFAAHAAW